MKEKVESRVKKLERILTDNPMTYSELLKASDMTLGEFKHALRRIALLKRRISKDERTGLYCLPGQERLALEKKHIGSIGNRQKLIIVKEMFHEILALRLSDYHDGKWKVARGIAERIEPIMKQLKAADPRFPYTERFHGVLEYPPEADGLEATYVSWQKYCADIMEYCDTRLGSLPPS